MAHPCYPRILKGFPHCQIERGSSGERQLGWWTGNPGGTLTASPTGPLEVALGSEATSSSTYLIKFSPWNVEPLPCWPKNVPLEPESLCVNVQSRKVLVSSAWDQYHELVWKIAWRNENCGRNNWAGRKPGSWGYLSREWDFGCSWCLQLGFQIVGEKICLSR